MVDDDSRAKKQMMCSLGANSDIILNLPDNVIDGILVRLPIRDAVRTSILSTEWRYKWTTITQLVFHYYNNNNNSKEKLINLIDRVLLLHSGFIIRKFELSSVCLRNCSTIDCWILFLLRKNIKELVLKFSQQGGERYKLPTCLFYAQQQISTLELEWCVLKPPPTFTGFSNLKSLCLKEITVDNGGFECLISKCPVLERLTLIITRSLDHLNLCSPNLKYLCLIGPFEDICFQNTPLLSDVSIHTTYLNVEKLNKFLQSDTGNVVKVLGSLTSLRKFVVGQFFLKFLTVGKIPEKLPFTCHHLNNLSLRLNFECVNEICVTLCLLNSSPNLQELDIETYPLSKSGHNSKNFWERRTLIDWNMSGLQIVKITDIKESELELEFIKLLLANSPMLEMLSIRSSKGNECSYSLDSQRQKFLKELLTFPRASPKSRIKFFERNEK